MFGFIAKLNDFSWADKGEVQWIEEKQEPFIFVGIKAKFFEFVRGADPCLGFEVRCYFTDSGSNDLRCHQRYVDLNYVEKFENNSQKSKYS